jgi:hypothetical protein
VRKEADAKRLQAEFEEHFTPLLFDVTDEAAVRHAALYVRALMNGHTLMGLVNNADASFRAAQEPLSGNVKLNSLRVWSLYCRVEVG